MRFSFGGAGSILVLVFACLVALVPLANAGVIYIQPIQVCETGGGNCADSGHTLFGAEGNKIWAQAGLNLSFLPWNVYDSTAFQVIDNVTEELSLWGDAGHGASADATVISMWFVKQLYPLDPGTTFGESELVGNRISIADAVFTTSRIDTIAHEIGHNLGLPHYTNADPNIQKKNLMTAGATREVPASIANITPDGTQDDQLNPGQLTIVADSTLIHPDQVPEPVTTTLVGAGLVGLALLRRRAG